MRFRLTTLLPTTLVGHCRRMSLLADATGALWQGFMRQLKAGPLAGSTARYAVQVYAKGYFEAFEPAATFEKWAAVAAAPGVALPAGWQTLALPGGLYAVFEHRGPAGPAPFRYILETWLPTSGYALDARPHFELLGEKYYPNSAESEEEIWIPIKPGPSKAGS